MSGKPEIKKKSHCYCLGDYDNLSPEKKAIDAAWQPYMEELDELRHFGAHLVDLPGIPCLR